ncbi:MAG TPA: nuclear transport factor 2 family protein [Candidatus Acidoferrum sp.]|nr:nuclear transport factor 2 family protein [Candidatus Acidoferrum sp.]
MPKPILHKALAAAIFAAVLHTTATAQSLAPPHAPIVEGKPVPVVAHPQPAALLTSKIPALAANKKLVSDYWRNVQVAGNANAADQYLAAGYVEHNPLLPSSLKAVKSYVAATQKSAAVPATVPDLVTLVAEGPYVVMARISHYPEPDKSGNSYTSTRFDMFRIDNGRIAEHWDSALFRSGEKLTDFGADSAKPVVGTLGPAQLAMLNNADPDLFQNKRLAFDLWRQIPDAGREEMAELYLDPTYIQHNPNAATGRAGFQEYFSHRPDAPIDVTLKQPLVAQVAEGDLVVQVLKTERTHPDNKKSYNVPWFDMFRIAGHRIIEHWDSASKGELPAVMQEQIEKEKARKP